MKHCLLPYFQVEFLHGTCAATLLFVIPFLIFQEQTQLHILLLFFCVPQFNDFFSSPTLKENATSFLSMSLMFLWVSLAHKVEY